MSKFFGLFFLLIINGIYNSKLVQNEYIINIIDNTIKTSNFSLSISDGKDYYYIITGENLVSGYEDEKSFKRYILKYDINTNILVDKYISNSSYPFEIPNVILIGKNHQYLLTITKYSIEFFNGSELKEYKNENINIIGKSNLIKIDSYYYIIFIEEITKNNKPQHFIILYQIEIIEDESPSYKIIKISEPLKAASYLTIASCSSTNDKLYIICAYYSNDSYFSISVFDRNLYLVQTEKGEILNEINQFDIFIKILYFKDNNKFIIINSQNDYTIRLRYLKYINGSFINQLYSITDSNEPYLDIEENQFNPVSNYNDAIASDQDKIIKISTYDSQIIISIYQFYEHDTALFVKNYKLENNVQLNYKLSMNPYINLIKNSVLITLSTNYDQRSITGYFFLNYPNSKDLTLNENSFLVKDLINMENTIYNLDLKLKILEIPNNFIFIKQNISSNYIEIKEGDILELNDEIILRQYKIKENSVIFKYKGIAKGNDSGYDFYKIYPSNHDIPENSDIYLEGKEGHLYINFDECLEGYYQLEDDENICTNKNPKGYYLDEKDKIYKKCKTPCLDCSGPFISNNEMNCISCIDNYIITEDTQSCYDYTPLNYIIENNILKRCYHLCNKCIKPSKNDSDMNCLQCEYGYFLKDDTHNCIKPEDYQKKEIKNLSQMNSEFMILFIFIFIFAILTSVGISLSCLYKCKGEDETGEQNDDEENQKINNKDEKSESEILSDSQQSNEFSESIN